jgi:hypothetical protein
MGNKKGSVQVDTGAQMPQGFPRAVPLPSGLALDTSLGAKSSKGDSFDLIYDVKGSVATAVKRYDAALAAAGFTMNESSSIGGIITQEWQSATWTMAITTEPPSGGGSPATLDLVLNRRHA